MNVDYFERLFDVLDAKRINKDGLKEIMSEEKFTENVKKYAFYSIDLV